MKYKMSSVGSVVIDGVRLFRIVAVRDIRNHNTKALIPKGTVGGFVSSFSNLSHSGGCWIYDGSTVKGDATVSGEAIITGCVTIDGDAHINGNAIITGCVTIDGNTDMSEGTLE